MTSSERKRPDISIVTVLITVALLAGGVVWVVHSELARIDARMNAAAASMRAQTDSFDKRMAGLETAIRILSGTQGKPGVSGLVDGVLAVGNKVYEAPTIRAEEKAWPSMKPPAARVERKAKPEPAKVAPPLQRGGKKPL